MRKTIAALFVLLFLASSAKSREIISINNADCVAGHILVKFKSIAEENQQDTFNQRQLLMTQMNATKQRRFTSGIELWRVAPSRTIDAIQTLNKNPYIEFAEPNYLYSTEIIPNDPFFDELWGLDNTGESGMNDADIDAPEAWELEQGNGDVIVGIIDSGIDYNHPDLRENMWLNPGEIPDNGIDDDGNGYVDDVRGFNFDTHEPDPMDAGVHGTHVAGIIGAKTNNGIGTCGIAWNVQLMPLKFMDGDGRGTASDAVTAIEYAIVMGADILNLSWGGTAFSETLYAGLASADSAGLLIVCSAGNAATDNDLVPHYPSSYKLENLISVTASDANDGLASFANWGIESVDICAPGVSILSTAPEEKYGYMSGSSMAAPHVTGTGALLWSSFPTASARDLKYKMLASADHKQSLIGTSQTAARLNAFAALTDSSQSILSGDPNYLAFGITLVGETTSARTIYLSNNSADTLTIHAIPAPDGFLIRRIDNSGAAIGSFTMNPWSTDSIDVIFSPHDAMEYRQFIRIDYSNRDVSQTEYIQLYGRAVQGTLVKAGAISGTWHAEDGPFYIMGDVAVSGTLDINPGVQIEFEGPYSLTVGAGARLRATGAEMDSILFSAYDQLEGWRGLLFLDSGMDDVLLYCAIRHGKKLGSAELAQEKYGGALYCSNSSPTLQHCRLSNNYAIAGGAVYLTDSFPVIENSSIVNNRAASDGGGGISCYNSDPELFRVVIANNRALNFFADADNGGGILCWSSSPRLINVTLAGNVADKGGGIYISQKGSNPIIVNSILWDNIPNEAEFSKEPKSKSLVVAYSDVEDGADGIETGSVGTLYWLDGNMNAPPNFVDPDHADFRLIQGSPCIDKAVHNTTIIYDAGRIDIPVMSYLGVGPDLGACESDRVLPVELSDFTARAVNSDVILSWTTASETNNYRFVIQKSVDDEHYTEIGAVPGVGTSVQHHKYMYVDRGVPGGSYFYRLEQIDFDGTRTRSSSIKVNMQQPLTLQLNASFPNPFNSYTTFHYEIPRTTLVHVCVYNALGQKIKTLIDEIKDAGRYSIKWDATNDALMPVATGLYILSLKTAAASKHQKVMVLR